MPNWLVPPAGRWTGTLGTKLTKAEFRHYVTNELTLRSFKPVFITIHNTAAPNRAQWLGPTPPLKRLQNITGYYANDKGWPAGPHLFIDNLHIYLFTPLWLRGVHSPSWNGSAWGIEMVGDYEKESFSDAFGGAVRDNTAWATACLLQKLGLTANGATIKLHKEDRATSHACPGKNVVKADFVKRTGDALATIQPPIA